jgi:hypothetical protein
MTDLQLGLLALGAAVVVGVLVYNRVQEHRARRAAERAFRPPAVDALLGGSAPRAAPAVEARAAAPPVAALPDARIDYVIELRFAAPVALATLREQWKPFEHRYAKRTVLACTPGDGWARLGPEDAGSAVMLRAGLQLATREGAVGEAELIEFRAAVETLAAATGGVVAAPEVRRAVERARALDRFCADADIQVVLHVVSAAGGGFDLERVRGLARADGLAPVPDGRFVLRDAEGGARYALGLRAGGALAGDDAAAGAVAGLSLTLDVARVAETRATFREMAAFAGRLAAALEGTLVDDNGRALGEAELGAIEAQLGGVDAAFAEQGIVPGDAAALRLFA